MELSEKELDHAIKLAHLEIEDSKKPHFIEQLNNVLGYMKSMDDFDLEGVSPSSHATESEPYRREDTVTDKLDLKLAENAPKWEQDCFRVPKII